MDELDETQEDDLHIPSKHGAIRVRPATAITGLWGAVERMMR